MIRVLSMLSVLAVAVATAGCLGGAREREIPVQASNDPLTQPRDLLKRYAEGQPMASEVSTFPAMVENVRKTDPARAEILEKGLAELKNASPGERKAKARALLQKLQPSMK